MKTKVRNGRRNILNWRTWEQRYARSARMEQLEHRHLLSGTNLFAQFTGRFDPARGNDIEQLAVTIAPEQLGVAQDRVVLGFRLQTQGGGTLDPDAVDIYHANGQRVSALYSQSNVAGTTDSLVVAELRGGDYRIDLSGQVTDRSQYRLDVFLVGDTDGDHMVDRTDLLAIQRMQGAQAGDGVYLASADADMDGRITQFDVLMARRNEAYSRGGVRPANLLYSVMGDGDSGETLGTYGGAYDRIAAITPQDGYRADAPMRFFESTIGWVQPLSSQSAVQGGVFTVPGDPGTVNPVCVHWYYREAGYGNDISLFTVDDDEGRIGALAPGDVGYHGAASLRVQDFPLDGEDCQSPQQPDKQYEVSDPEATVYWLEAGTKFSFYVTQGSYKELAWRPGYQWFVFPEANVDLFTHFQSRTSADSLGAWYDGDWAQNVRGYKVEDLSANTLMYPNPAGFDIDVDFNDVKFTFDILSGDLDVDSDNNDVRGVSQRSSREDSLEADSPGKIITVTEARLQSNYDDLSRRFVPMIVAIQGGAKADVPDIGVPTFRFTASNDLLRLWTVDGDQVRDPDEDLLEFNRGYTAEDLGLTYDEDLKQYTTTLYVEALATGHTTVDLEICLESTSYVTDTVAFTAIDSRDGCLACWPALAVCGDGAAVSYMSDAPGGGGRYSNSMGLIDTPVGQAERLVYTGNAVAIFDRDQIRIYDMIFDNPSDPDDYRFEARRGEEVQGALDWNAGGTQLIETDPFGNQRAFSANPGRLEQIDAPGDGATQYQYDQSGRLTQTTTTIGNGATRTVSYTYTGGQLTQMTVAIDDGSGPETVRTVQYAYHSGSDGHGTAGDLKLVTTLDAQSQAIDRKYYRYYVDEYHEATNPGHEGALKLTLSGASIQRAIAGLQLGGVAGLDTATDEQLKPYADEYLEYDERHLHEADLRVAWRASQGAGCSLCDGLGGVAYEYATSEFPEAHDHWKHRRVETLPDGSTVTTYTNVHGNLLLRDVYDGANRWITYHEYDANGNRTLTAHPSAVLGYDDAVADLAVSLRASAGLIEVYDYYTSTTAPEYPTGGSHPQSGGGVEGYFRRSGVQEGSGGAIAWRSETDYVKKTANDRTVYFTFSTTQYAETGGGGAQTTTYYYTFHPVAGDVTGPVVHTRETILPAVSAAKHGAGTTDSRTDVYDTFGRLVWSRDATGYLRYTEYDPATGAVTKRIADVDTSQTGDFDATYLPGGWSTPAGGGAHLTTTSEADALGRTVKTTGSDGAVTHTVYLESAGATEIRTYRGWHDTGGGVYATTGPVEVYRHDREGNYTESLTFHWSGAAGLPAHNGRPTGAESLTSANATIESLSRSLMNDAGQMTLAREYFDLSGTSYSDNRDFGTEGTHYVEATMVHDTRGRVAVTQSPGGTSEHTFYDARSRVVQTWVGTDDVPDADHNGDGVIDLRDFRYYVANYGTAPAGTDMVVLNEYEYDGGSDRGNGLLTKVTEHVDDVTTRTTEYGYDWRNRRVWTYQHDGTYGTYTYLTYDNLGRVTKTERYYDADDDFSSQGPEIATDDILIARSETAYDERGRVYATTYYGVDPTDGTVNATALSALTWYDAVGNIIKTQSPGTDLFTKTSYDGLGRPVVQYVGFDLDEDTYAEAGNVDGDTIFAQTEWDYGAAGNTIFVTTRHRLHDATGTGALGGPSGDQPKSRDSYMAYWYDELGRQIAMADYGTNGGTVMDVGDRPSAPPARSNTVLVTTSEYDLAGRPYKTIDPSGREDRTEYDHLGRVIRTIRNYIDGNPATGGIDEDVTLEMTYTADGHVATQTDPLGAVTSYEYDFLGRTTKIIAPDPDGPGGQEPAETLFAYNRIGELLSVTDANNETTNYEYDLLGRLTKTITPAAGGHNPAEHATVYDVLARVHTETNPLGHSTTYEYDDFDRLVSRTDAENGTTAYTYDWAGNQLTLTDPVGNTTTWVYDAMNRMIEETNELHDSRQFVYDGGLLVRQVDRRGWVRQFEFDRFARNSGEIWYDDTSDADADQNRRNTFTFTYDRLGRMLSGEDAYAAYDYAYDGLGRPVQITQNIVGLDPQIVFTAEYDAAGRRTQVAATIGATEDFVTDYTYDNAGRIDTIQQQSQQGGNAVAEKYIDFVFDVANRPSQLRRYADLAGANLVAHTDYVFDEVGRLTGLTHAKGGTTFADYDLAYDLAGRMTAFDFTSLVGDSGDAAYSLDDTGQLTGADYAGDWQDDEDYVYDENGNRVTARGATYVTGANNRLLSDGTYRYAYDEEGNRTLKFIDADQSGTLSAGDTDITQYTWDHRNRLTKVSQFADYTAYAAEEPDQVVEYAYDFGQRWVRKVLDANGNGTADGSTVFVHDNGQIVLEFERAGTGDAAAADLARRYLWGPALDQLLAQETVDDGSSDDVLWALTDHLNSVRDLAQYDEGTDTTTVARHVVYDAFGNVTSDTAPAVRSLFLYTARPFDEHTGLQNNLNRWYDAQVGRWLSEDPVGFAAADTNLSRYCRNEPLLNSDPMGLWLRVSGSIWMAEPDDRSFDDLVAQATNGRLPAKNRVLIHPFAPSFWDTIGGLRGGDMWREMREAWERQEPAPCAFYDVGNLTDDWPSGGELMFSVGTDQNRYIQAASLFYMIPGTHYSLTADQAIRLIETHSNRGATPIKKLTIIGHSWRRETWIGGTGGQPGGQERFTIDLFGPNVAGDPPWPSWEDARARNLHPLGWFRTDAEVRFVGCMTSLFASRFASALLRPGATAHGTTRATWAPSWPHDGATLDNPFPPRQMGWGTGTSPATWRFDWRAPTATSPALYHLIKPHWTSFSGGG